MNGVQTRLKCKPNVKRCKRFVFAAHSPLLHPNTLKTKAIIHFQTDHILTRFVFPPLHIAFVFQNTKLFKTSLLENIKYGNPAASDEAVQRAIDLSQSREIIDRLPNGLNTKIGVDGTFLSGGEQQRIVLARAILKDAPIVVLDEATAFADPENEHLIQKALHELRKGKTVLMIAHHLTSVQDADKILVIAQGKIAEEGTHSELIARNGIYNSMWNEYQRTVTWTV